MNISLPDRLKTFLETQVADLGYGTSSEYVRDLIRKEKDRSYLRALVLEGFVSEPTALADDVFFTELRDQIARFAEA